MSTKTKDLREWVLLSLLLLLPSGVFALACIDPQLRPAAVQFAQVAFGSVISRVATERNIKRLPKSDKKPD